MTTLEKLTQEALEYTTSKRGGGTIGHQLAHIYNVRFWKLEKYPFSKSGSRSFGRWTEKKCHHKIKTAQVKEISTCAVWRRVRDSNS
jgi:hypothetical protein